MDTQNENREMLSPYVSVDCVLLGINDDKLTVLLAERKSEEGELIGYKLPGSLIYENEDLDDAAYRILNDSTGLKRVQLKQFRCFGSPARTSNRLDVMWLEATSKVKIGRLITVAYLALCKNSRKTCPADKSDSIRWCPIDDLPRLPFDHKEIIEAAIQEIRNWVEKELNSLEYVVPTEDMQDGVAHRAARYYRFDKVKYNQQRSKFNKI